VTVVADWPATIACCGTGTGGRRSVCSDTGDV